MEKDIPRVHYPFHRQRSERKSIWVAVCHPIYCVLTLWFTYHAWSYFRALNSPATESAEFSWNQVSPTTYLNYTTCFGHFQCTRLDVPMDWNDTNPNGPRVSVAIVRLPAPVSVTDPRYGGIILTNPGGPGGSGVDQALSSAEKFATIINPSTLDISQSDGKFFDIMSFDPRGVNNTTPGLKCFPDTFSYDIWRHQEESDGIGSSTAVSKLWARAKALTNVCSQSGGIVHHMNTPVVVADMVEIIEKHAEWRSKEANIWLESKEGQSVINRVGHDHAYSKESIIERTRWRQGEEKIQFWGFSYGSLLGATFAALQPHRVERIILDGVEDSTDYYTTAWALNLKDADKVIEKFYEYCSSAGPKKCAFNFGTSDPAEIKKAFESLISGIKEDPIAVPATATRGPQIITYSDVMQVIRMAVYKPLVLFPQLADLLADLKGNGSAAADFKAEHNKPSCPLQKCNEKGLSEPCYPDGATQPTPGIMCSDGADISNPTKARFIEYTAALYNDSKWLGEFWSTIAVKCYHWKGQAAWRIKSEEICGNTSHPILWIGNTFDPVTPLKNAHTMSKRFPGSVVLQQDSEGHCSPSSPSLCTGKYIREYFQTGKLPPPGTICQPQELPFIGNQTANFHEMSADDMRLLAAMKDLAQEKPIYNALGF